MASAIPIDQPVIVFNRIEQNRYKGWLLAAITVLAPAPFVVGVSYPIANLIVGQTQAGRRAMPHGRDEGNSELRWKLIAMLSVTQMAGLGLLFWSLASSPTAKLLADAGAMAAGAGESQAKRQLEDLAAAAGLPPPKLYVIESSAPNAFAAELDADHAMVAVTRGLLKLLDAGELDGVLAHELSHIGNLDVRLNALVAAIALFLRIPYLLFQRLLDARKGHAESARGRNPWRMALSPIGLYILFVAPVLGAAIRAVVARAREFQADQDATLLTGCPDALMRALAKIGAAGSVVTGSNPAFAHFYFASPAVAGGWLGGNLVASHPPVTERIQGLAAIPGSASVDALKQALEQGRRYSRECPAMGLSPMMGGGAQDELASFNRGNPGGRVYRLVASQPFPVYENPTPQHTHDAMVVLTRVKPGALLVAFDDPGKMRQVNTADQTFGYMERSAKLVVVPNMIPAEVYDPVARAAAEANLPPLASPETLNAAAAAKKPDSLTVNQIVLALVMGIAVFAGMFLVLMRLGK